MMMRDENYPNFVCKHTHSISKCIFSEVVKACNVSKPRQCLFRSLVATLALIFHSISKVLSRYFSSIFP